MTYIRPHTPIFTGVIHKEGSTSDIHKTGYTVLHCFQSIRKVTPVTVTPVTYRRPHTPIFPVIIHKEGNTSDSNTSDIHMTLYTDIHCCYP